MSLSCQSSNSPCVPSVHVVNVNSQLCADPAANVVIMETPRLYTSSMPWIDTYGQSVATRTLAESTNVVPATVRVGAPGHSTVQSQRLITNASKSSALVSNTGFSNAPVRGTYVQSASAQTFSPPAPDHATHAPVGNTGYTVSASVVPPTTGPSYGLTPLVNPTQSYGNILTSPIPDAPFHGYGHELNYEPGLRSTLSNSYNEQRAGFHASHASLHDQTNRHNQHNQKALSETSGNLIEHAANTHGVDPQVFRAFNQADSESCVAASIGYGLVLVALANNDPGTLAFVKRHKDVPSINYAYHKMRQLECLRTGQCSCGPACSSTCNADCGSLVSVGLEIFENGVPPATVWPEDKPDDVQLVHLAKTDPRMGADHLFYLDSFHPIETSALDVLEALRKGHPVIINLRVWPNQKTFFTTGAPSYVRGYGVADPYNDAYRLPQGNGPPPENYGHCLLIYGYSLDHQAFLVRNSFGPNWGYMGDFSIGFDQVTPSQMFQTVALTSASTK